MGGYGSGGGRIAGKVHHFLDLDMAVLNRLGAFKLGQSCRLAWSSNDQETGAIELAVLVDRMVLSYRHKAQDGEWRDVEQTIYLDRTGAGFGGMRTWLLCPNCGRRCRVLYGGSIFVCRTCRRLVYHSQYEAYFSAAHDRVRRIRRRLGATDLDTWAASPPKPKGMHKNTFERLVGQIYEIQEEIDVNLNAYAAARGYLDGRH